MDDLARAQQGDERAFEALVAPFQRELRAHCYRMAGSIDDADDLLQESLLRAWRGLKSFEGRATLRTWLYRVASSACIDRLKNRSARKRVEEIRPASLPSDAIPEAEPDQWIGPCPASLYTDAASSPEARYSAKESVGFAFLAALQLLAPKQRATLIACDVLGFSAEECAEILETSAPSVRSALQRARETIADRAKTWSTQQARATTSTDDDTRALLDRYVAAWERADGKALVTLLHDDATMSMPPLPIWLQGAGAIAASIDAMVFSSSSAGGFRAIATEANGHTALAMYRRGTDGAFVPYALQVLSLDDGGVRSLAAFLDTRVFAAFDLPAHLAAA